MPWYVLLIIALASLALVIAMLAWLALKAWRLAKHGVAVSRRVTPLVEGLTRRADEAAAAAERLSADGEQLTASIARMQGSLARLQVVGQTLNDALRPYKLLRGWLSGEREWSELRL
jgi:cell division protein FtsB